MKSLGLIAHTHRPRIKDAAEHILNWAGSHGIESHICRELVPIIGHEQLANDQGDLWKKCDVLISLGGDGTMLAAARAAGDHDIPLLGINLGNLGFLTEVAENQINEALESLISDDYLIEERMVLEASFPDNSIPVTFALNDVVIDHSDSTKLAKIDLYSNGLFVSPYLGDGIIVSTPTGSTAYSLSVGGPIIKPSIEALSVSPISSHTLTLRTIIFAPDDVLTIRVSPTDIHLRVAIDGFTAGKLISGQEAVIKRAKHKIKFIKFESRSYFEILRAKLHLGARPL